MATRRELRALTKAIRKEFLGELAGIEGGIIAAVRRELEEQLALIMSGSTDPGVIQRQVRELFERIETMLEGAYTAANTAGVNVGWQQSAANAERQKLGVLTPTPQISAAQRAIYDARKTNLIRGLSADAQRAVNALTTDFLDPDKEFGFREMRARIKEITDATARHAVTQIRTESNTLLSAARREADKRVLADVGAENAMKEWLPSFRGGHDGMADHPVIPWDDKFDAVRVGGSGRISGPEPMDFPRDPNASAEQTINCGCDHVMIFKT